MVALLVGCAGAADLSGDRPVEPLAYFADVVARPDVRATVGTLAPGDQQAIGTAAAGWMSAPLMGHGTAEYSYACEPHLCAAHRITVVLDGGRVWFGFTEDAARRVVGGADMPDDVRDVLAAR
jgi:hypothetical protein